MNEHSYLTISAAEARKRGYKPLTRGCTQAESWMLHNFIRDMMAGGIAFTLVREEGNPASVAVYRKPGKVQNGNGRAV